MNTKEASESFNYWISSLNDDGTYGKPQPINGITEVNFTDSTCDETDSKNIITSEPMTFTFDVVSEESLNGIFEEHRTCVNCGASVHGNCCEYCGTEYRTIPKIIFERGDNK